MIYSFLYVFVISFSNVLIEKLYFSISPLFSLLITASIATLYFNIVNIHKLKNLYRQCWQQKWDFIGIMSTILVMWGCSMTAPGLIGASLSTFLYFTWLGTLGFISLGIINWKGDRIKFYLALCALSLLIIVIWNYLDHTFSKTALAGVLLSLIGGTSAFVYFKQSQAVFKKTRLSATQILAVRFYLTIIVMLIVLPKGSFALYSTTKNFLELILLGVLCFIIPLYFQQKALEKISSEQNAIIISISPITIAVVEEIVFRDVNLHYIIIYFLYTLIVASSYFVNRYSRRRIANEAK